MDMGPERIKSCTQDRFKWIGLDDLTFREFLAQFWCLAIMVLVILGISFVDNIFISAFSECIDVHAPPSHFYCSFTFC